MRGLATVDAAERGRLKGRCAPSRLPRSLAREGKGTHEGEPVLGGLHGPHRQEYCPHCKNWLFTRPHGLDFFVNVRASALDDHSWYVPYVEGFTSEKLPWATTPARYSFATQPDMDGYQPIIAAFAREGARPA